MKFYVCTDVTHTHTHTDTHRHTQTHTDTHRHTQHRHTQTHTDTHRHTQTHTHTPCLWQGGVRANEVKMRVKRGMKMRWKWRWDEGLLNRDARRGTQKKREGANTHQHTWPGAGKPWKGQEKRKAEADGHGTRPAEGGQDGSAWTNLTQRQPTPTSARARPNLPREGRTHEIRDRMGN